ncbi:MAG: linoleoyl-CoA desaturase [Rhodothermales bacterium]|jgi:linoleoyl-CoA desaturase
MSDNSLTGTDKAAFFPTLKKAVYDYLGEHNLQPQGGGRMYRKCLLIFILWAGAYSLAIYTAASMHIAVAILATLGLVACTLFAEMGIMHDASHDSLSKKRSVNRWMDVTLILAGAAPVLWHHKHVRAHHHFTNVPGKDHDIEAGRLFRFHKDADWHPWHRFQHWYAVGLYSLLGLKWIWVDDVTDAVSNRYSVKGKDYAIMWMQVILARISHFVIHLAIPYYFVGNAAIVIGLYLMHWVAVGVFLAVTFQLAHITDVQEFPETLRGKDGDWAVHQLSTTADFAVGNRLLTWAIGGLNYQVEHHIFPRISHVHYAKIQPIVRQLCEEYGITYFEYPTVREALRAHFRHLASMGRPPQRA